MPSKRTCDHCGQPVGVSAYETTPQIPELRHLYLTQQPEAYGGAVCSLARTERLKQQQSANLAPSGTD